MRARCRRLAARGYVTISIDYRLLWSKLRHPGDIQHAMWDARAAVRWLRRNRLNGTSLRVDPDRIAAFGSSAGGMAVTYLVSVDGEGDNPDNAGVSSAVRAGVSLSGARFTPLANTSNMTGTEPAYLDFHGCADPMVPYDCDGGCTCEGRRSKMCWGSAVDTNREMRAAGAQAELYAFAGAGHVPWGDLRSENASSAMEGWLAEHLDLAHAECPVAGM